MFRILAGPNTVARVYRDLEREGLLETRRGQGTFVADAATALAEADRVRMLEQRLGEAADFGRRLGISERAMLKLFREILGRSVRGLERVSHGG